MTDQVSGKGGGKETSAQATLDGPENVNEALDVARSFAKLKLLVE